jgi:hypothetical protein
MAYSGPPNYDEFNDESIAAFWTNVSQTQATASEESEGVLRATFNGVDDTMQRVVMDQDAGDSFTPIPAGTPWEIHIRFYVPPYVHLLDPGLTDVFGFHYFEWTMWDENIAIDMRLTWNVGQTPGGRSMDNLESCYTFEVNVANEYDSEALMYGPTYMLDVTDELAIADETHNGWFRMSYKIDANGIQTFTLQPDFQDPIDVTPPGLTVYDLDIGGKAGWGWGWDLNLWEWNVGPTYTEGSPGPLEIDWVRDSWTQQGRENWARGSSLGTVNEGFGGFGFGWG